MKGIFRHIIFCLLTGGLLFHLSAPAVSQEVNKPPYPIIFIHGWAGSDSTWMREDYTEAEPDENWKTYFENDLGWNFGGRIDICLEMNTDSLHDEAYSDVACLTESVSSNGDFFMINFDVKRNSIPYPKVFFSFLPYGPEDEVLQLDGIWLYLLIGGVQIPWPKNGDIGSIAPDDILCTYIHGTGNEYMKVTSVDYTSNLVTVERGCYNSLHLTNPPPEKSPYPSKNHSNLSSQASAVKQGIGVKQAIQKVRQATGATKVILICHSMGGLAAREYIQSSNYIGDVAKIITVSTPHLGSNLSNAGIFMEYPPYDTRSDAVRDLRYNVNFLSESYPPDPPYPNQIDNAPYLFSGIESFFWDPSFNFYSTDINGDGEETLDYIQGINNKEWPDTLLFHAVITEAINNLGNGRGDDYVVRCDRQYPGSTVIPNTLMDTTVNNLTQGNLIDPTHNHAHRKIVEVMRGFDEPDTRELAWNIKINQPNIFYNGFTNLRPSLPASDIDCFKFTADDTGLATVEILDIINTASWHLNIYESADAPPVYYVDNISQPDGNASISFDVIQGQVYYFSFLSQYIVGSTYQPYRIKVTTQYAPAQIYVNASPQSTYQFLPVAVTCHALDYNGNPLANTLIAFSHTGQGEFADPQGSSAYTDAAGDASVVYVPYYSGEHMITATAVNGLETSLVQPITVSGYLQGEEGDNLIIGYEYWVDNEIADKVFMGILPTTTFNLNKELKFINLVRGIHKLNIRFLDARGKYSLVSSHNFYYDPGAGNNKKIVSFDYWFDQNFAGKVTNAVFPAAVKNINLSIPVTGLTNGLHTFNFRVKDRKQLRSPTSSITFYYNSIFQYDNELSGYEYWFDDQYTNKVASDFSETEEYVLVDDVSFENLTPGLHTFHVRIKDNHGQWSETMSHKVYKSKDYTGPGNLVSEFRYFFDSDFPGLQTVAVNPQANPYDMAHEIDADAMTFGNHTVSYQYKDIQGLWSGMTGATFKVGLHLYVDAFLEGLFNPSTGQMEAAKNNLGNPVFPANIADSVTLELRNAASPHALAYSVGGRLQMDGTVHFVITQNLSGSYYIVLKNRNSIETWSAQPASFQGNVFYYDFTDAAGKAYGNNLKLIGGNYAIYSGDKNQDGSINATDKNETGTAAGSFTKGYVSSDINGNGVVDGLDLILIDNNADAGVVKKSPP
jgi:pimeloyl-ACP methyl ester carboxylesterase